MEKVIKKIFTWFWYIVTAVTCFALIGLALYEVPWIFLTGFFAFLLGVACFYLWKFSKIIMVLENDLGQATQALEEVEELMQQIIDMKLYFDTPEVQQLVAHVMESVRMAKFAVNMMIKNFTDRSKQKFIMVIEEEPELPLKKEEEKEQRPREGTVLSVERPNV